MNILDLKERIKHINDKRPRMGNQERVLAEYSLMVDVLKALAENDKRNDSHTMAGETLKGLGLAAA